MNLINTKVSDFTFTMFSNFLLKLLLYLNLIQTYQKMLFIFNLSRHSDKLWIYIKKFVKSDYFIELWNTAAKNIIQIVLKI